ncbi:MAG: transglutaminase-like domain-containing protein [Oscillospiraceae bacterium]|jgi:hypothetical protein|nr:transglutaminase-like domain-containing protein [Oscillospiraceae bacterium]
MKKKLLSLALVAVMLTTLLAGTLASAADANILSNDKAKVDITNIANGYVKVAYTGGGTEKIKVTVTDANKVQYSYNLNNKGDYEIFPLSQGDGKYQVGVFKNTSGTKYSSAFSTSFDVKLKDQYAPFTAPNQYVNYSDSSKVVAKASELTKDAKNDLEKVSKIYDYLVKNFTYDKDKAAEVSKGTLTGYVPNVDDALAAKKGICFDYASTAAAMLRSQKIPCKLVIGYAGDVYHAWINIYTKETGWVDGVIQFDGKNWKLADPTFASTGGNSDSAKKYIGDGKNYTAKYTY